MTAAPPRDQGMVGTNDPPCEHFLRDRHICWQYGHIAMPGKTPAIMIAGTREMAWPAMEGWVAHVDESGHEPGVRGELVRFVLACVAASPKTTAKIGEKIRRFKLELAPHLDPADWELHAGDMFHNRIGSPLGSMTTDEKMATMRRIVDIVCDSDAVTFIVTVTGVRARGKGGRNTRIVEHATTLLVERLERFAQDRGRMTLRVISDNVPEGQRLAMERATGRRASGPMSRRGAQAVTGIEFADSRSSAML